MIHSFREVSFAYHNHTRAIPAPTAGIPNRIAKIGINVLSISFPLSTENTSTPN